MIVYNTSNRTITLKDTAGTLYNVSAYSSLFVSNTKLTDTEFLRWLRLRDRDIVVDLGTSPAPSPMVSGQGLVRETFARNTIQGTTAPSVGVINGTAVSLYAGDVIQGLSVGVSANGSGLTLAKLAIYSKAGVKLADSASNHANFNAGTTPRNQSTLLQNPYTVPTTDLYYFAFLFVTSTAPTLLRGASQAAADVVVGSGAFPWMLSTGSQTDLLASFTPLTGTNAYWFGAT